jgi:hypothetical protein
MDKEWIEDIVIFENIEPDIKLYARFENQLPNNSKVISGSFYFNNKFVRDFTKKEIDKLNNLNKTNKEE